MNTMQQEVVRQLTDNFHIDKDYVLNCMIEKYPTLIQALENALCTTKPELRKFVKHGGYISSKVVADCVLGLESLDVEVVKFNIRQVNVWSGGTDE